MWGDKDVVERSTIGLPHVECFMAMVAMCNEHLIQAPTATAGRPSIKNSSQRFKMVQVFCVKWMCGGGCMSLRVRSWSGHRDVNFKSSVLRWSRYSRRWIGEPKKSVRLELEIFRSRHKAVITLHGGRLLYLGSRASSEWSCWQQLIVF